MQKILIILILFAFVSCNTVAKQQRKAETFYQEHPEKLAAKCSATFPVDTVFKQGATILKTDTTFIKGDSVACPVSVNAKGDTVLVKVKCPDSKIIRDTILRTDTITKIDNARIAYLTYQRDSLYKALIAASTSLQDKKHEATRDTWIIVGLGILLAGGIILKIKNLI